MTAIPPDDDTEYVSRYMGANGAAEVRKAKELRLKRHTEIMRWLETCDDPVAHEAMRTWALAVLSGHGSELATGSFRDTGERGFPNLNYAIVPGTNALVVYYEILAPPVRIVRFVSVGDLP